MTETIQTLKDWASSGKLAEATLSEDGTTLTLGDVTIPAAEPVSVSHEDKSCSYSLASIYLQIREPDQSVLKLREACKQYNAKRVMALDKPVILGFFLGVTAAEPTASAPAVAGDSKSYRQKPTKVHKKGSSAKHRKHDKNDAKARPKQPKELVTNEQLFDSLNTVVGKRQAVDPEKQQEQQELIEALSPEGFQVTPELLEEYKKRTERIMAHELPVGTSASILRAPNPSKNLSRVLELFEQRSPSKSSQRSGTHDSRNKSSSSSKKSANAHLIGQKPMIVVPKGMTAPITIGNARDFFADAKFVPRGKSSTSMVGGRKKTMNFTRTVPGMGPLEYEIVDNPRRGEWDRIVAVIVLGQEWQFKDWMGPSYNTPAALFERVFGFYIGMEGAQIPASVHGWAVKQAKLNRDKRGMDQVVFASFWNGLDEWMKVRKPELLPQAMKTDY